MKKTLKNCEKLSLYIPQKIDKNEPIDIYLPIRSEFDDDEEGDREFVMALKKYEEDLKYLYEHPNAMDEKEFNEFVDDIFDIMLTIGIQAEQMQDYLYSISADHKDDYFRDLVAKSLSQRYQNLFYIEGRPIKENKQQVFDFIQE